MILLFIVLLLALPIFSLFLYQYTKRTAVFVASFPLVLLIGWWVVATNHYFVPSTNLQKESIGDYALQDTRTSEFFHKVGSFEKREKADGYTYMYDDFFLSTNKENKIVSLSVGSLPIETSSGLQVGDSLEKAKRIYGDHFYTYREMGLGKAVVYVDRKNRHLLTIWTKDEQSVANIWLSMY
ncbi:hypothetical protein JCM9140_1555 [Halalkalibacter wakoensis JCM 9140]|uniref:Uncharacterized protein n=1 Tax=Halalkalibacter wakoensis JCM 9140 TaxID=1236970 RepID=W4Q0U0_9BACI|nr:hypothetical protein [Halalkalibacter wakoensis]GAE25555.1 hypothetical protein JCM9140_1555 [Halalkalibacter wakoensis JCM 9140]